MAWTELAACTEECLDPTIAMRGDAKPLNNGRLRSCLAMIERHSMEEHAVAW